MSLNEKPIMLYSKQEQDDLNRKILVWLNTYPDKPVALIDYESKLSADTPGMALSLVQNSYSPDYDILGDYDTEYQFKLIYRIKPGNSTDKRLKADEVLDAIGEWAKKQFPDIGGNRTVVSIEPVARAVMFDVFENGDEDHQIMMKMTYHVEV